MERGRGSLKMALLIVLLSPPQSSGVCICELCLVKFLFFPLFFLLFCFPSVLSGNAVGWYSMWNKGNHYLQYFSAILQQSFPLQNIMWCLSSKVCVEGQNKYGAGKKTRVEQVKESGASLICKKEIGTGELQETNQTVLFLHCQEQKYQLLNKAQRWLER